MAYTIVNPLAGATPIAATDAGVYAEDGSTVIPSGPYKPGSEVDAVDPTYGGGKFVLLKGVASTAVGSWVTFDPTAYTTTLVPTTAATGSSLAVAMSANTSASVFGWYQVYGKAVGRKGATSAFAAAGSKVYIGGSAGKVKSTGASSGLIVVGAHAATSAASGGSAGTTAVFSIAYPHVSESAA